jgi:16S rRNA (adenine1518-N6/adenine1519-N6)-dimethyltransferase
MRQHLGQHFLSSESWRERIARLVVPHVESEPKNSEQKIWIEIGAGHGEMTSLLAKQATQVIAVELDETLLPGLHALEKKIGNVAIVAGDVLTLNLAELAAGQRFSVYGNIPYYISSPIVHHLFANPEKLDSAFLVVQLEVAERLAAKPGGRDYGYLSAFAQFYARSEILLRIPSGAFRPPPKVDSALVALRTPGARPALGVKDEVAFIKFLKTCFAQKRKTLRNNLRSLLSIKDAEGLLKNCGIRPDARAEQLGLSHMAGIFRRIYEN